MVASTRHFIRRSPWMAAVTCILHASLMGCSDDTSDLEAPYADPAAARSGSDTGPSASETPEARGTCPDGASNAPCNPNYPLDEYIGHVTFSIARAATPTADESDAYRRIHDAMTDAVRYYNLHTTLSLKLSVKYDSTVTTNDWPKGTEIVFGSDRKYMNVPSALHFISHAAGVGNSSRWDEFIKDGAWIGTQAATELSRITGKNEPLHADKAHFWPFGVNYAAEFTGDTYAENHCRLVMAFRKDMRLP